jgi:hypothetical protein
MIYNCATCRKSRGLFVIGDIHKVKCYPLGLRDLPANGCSGWAGQGDELVFWPERIGTEEDVKKWRK